MRIVDCSCRIGCCTVNHLIVNRENNDFSPESCRDSDAFAEDHLDSGGEIFDMKGVALHSSNEWGGKNYMYVREGNLNEDAD
jgi:hypothetical protein